MQTATRPALSSELRRYSLFSYNDTTTYIFITSFDAVADADENCSVDKTILGGYTATPKAKAKISAALSGIGWSGRSKTDNSGRFRDDSYADVDQATTHGMEYGTFSTNDDDSYIDVIGMERLSLASNSPEKEVKTNSWSSRYTIDNTLLAMIDLTVSTSSISSMRIYYDPYSARILDRMYRENRGSSIGDNKFIKGANSCGFDSNLT